MAKCREALLDVLSTVLLACLSLVVASLLTQLLFSCVDDFVLHWFLGMGRQAAYNLMLFLELLVAGVLYATVILRFRRYEVQYALKGGERIRDIVYGRLLRQGLIFLAVFAVFAFVLAQIGVAERLDVVASPRAGKVIVSTGCEGFFGWELVISACGAFVPIIPQGWLAWLADVAAYAAMLWGGTWWFVYRTDRKLLGKKTKKT